MSNSLQPCGLLPTKLLSLWYSPGKNTGMNSHSLFQGIFLTQGLKLCLLWLLHGRWILYCWATREAPYLGPHICVLNEICHFIMTLCSTYNEIPDFIKTYIRTQCVRNIQICLGKLREELIEEIEHELIWALEAFQVDGGGKDVPRRKGRMYTKHNIIFLDWIRNKGCK